MAAASPHCDNARVLALAFDNLERDCRLALCRCQHGGNDGSQSCTVFTTQMASSWRSDQNDCKLSPDLDTRWQPGSQCETGNRSSLGPLWPHVTRRSTPRAVFAMSALSACPARRSRYGGSNSQVLRAGKPTVPATLGYAIVQQAWDDERAIPDTIVLVLRERAMADAAGGC